jgi:hypothetical protein
MAYDRPRRALRIFVLHSDAESGIFRLGCVATMMMMMSTLLVVCVAKKGKKERSAFGGSVYKEGQMHGDANGEPDAQEYYEQNPSTRVQ